MDKCNWAEHNYEKGFRATTIEGVRGFSDQTGWFKSLVDTLLHENLWIELRNVEISRTWKERHAKGVPVKMDVEEWVDKEVPEGMPDDHEPEIIWHTNSVFGYPLIGIYEPEGIPRLACFCNFRYKPEWLESKKAPIAWERKQDRLDDILYEKPLGGVTEW